MDAVILVHCVYTFYTLGVGFREFIKLYQLKEKARALIIALIINLITLKVQKLYCNDFVTPIGFDGKQETLFFNSKNKYQVYFRVYKYSDIYWDGVKIDFSGNNGNQFYKSIRNNEVNWEMFNYEKNIRLSRIDLCYYLLFCVYNINLESFLKQCYQKVSENKAIQNFNLLVGF